MTKTIQNSLFGNVKDNSQDKGQKVSLELPNWLNEFLYFGLKADCNTYNKNDSKLSDEVKLLRDLGRYFPLSYAVSFYIFNNILENDTLRKIYSIPNVRILNPFCGTGVIY